ncbi:50S ribosomal protein L16 [Candidatus Peregrinibacteria bacterium CG22_combo_CG10-13_8_21_14_all_44_10]|nr:MAG: 50S ribosomal protein L16 [Candidatus Peregrinibacteria bacterium CG2_30_44_17]PIP66057.1 MAG: 50S ribosomal protein L16 [Candidatus Peregrinibacteria bacterium CG22_combo_CG10-13_8_21_14_all_44_10]PIS03627.1 MAG: 50S ribosomal protein L16 [Candidatus Peregrinibacteria bacterium CG10_big_fil_rev_8_21_14_0_10_44_7]PIX78889.1 MAG: 50S ribosomal protein L16 [Candidatus Peregrinibacteria bacterium CG_4_10_14_3_um_filter_44_21]PJB88860.1 MAG: 50S ribosomal protein L16 [Candidatus Peregriniba
MLIPKKLKYRKSHRLRGAFKGVAQKGNKIAFGSYAIKAQTMAEITSRQIEAARRAMTRYIKRGGKIWIRIFPHQPITQKAAEVPMGSGKGNVEKYVSLVKPGTVIFEMEGIDEQTAREAMRLAGHKLPCKTKFISSHDIN